MRARAFCYCATIVTSSALAGAAEPSDPTAARAQLQIGYDLKEKGKCADAMPHFVESVRLDPQPKGFLNLADCEEKLGRLSAALSHFLQARDVATAPATAGLKRLAEQRIRALEARLPKLVVKLGKDAPSDATVLRDGVELGPISLNVPLPTDPGKHTVVVRSANAEKKYELTLAEGETKELEVSPAGGTATAPSAPNMTSTSQPSSAPPSDPTRARATSGQASGEERSDGAGSNPQRTMGFVGVGLGVAGLAVGTVFALRLAQKNEESDSLCRQPCSAEEQGRYYDAVDDARSARTLSMVGFGTGAVLGAIGGVLLLTASPSRSMSRLWISPTIGTSAGSLAVSGVW
jgi:hypothetical protein